MSPATYRTIVIFSILIFILFLIITSISGFQYSRYKIVDGTATCEAFVNRCLLVFPYVDGTGASRTKVSPIAFSEINQAGIWSVKVVYRLTDDGKDTNDFFILGSPFHVFLGTKSMFLIYLILTILSGLICLSYIPAFKLSAPQKK